MKARIDALVKDAKEYDPDKRFMAANDLCAELLKDQEGMDSALVKQICSIFLTQLDDISIDVQGNAVRCIKRIVTKIQETQVSEVIVKLGDCLSNGKEEFRDIYATCLKGLITDVPENYARIVCETMMPILTQGILNKNLSVAEEALEILSDLVKRFQVELHTSADRTPLVNGITGLLVNPKSSLKKKAINALGAVAVILPSNQLQIVVNGVIKSISSKGNKRDTHCYVQALSAISRSVGDKLTSYLSVLFQILSGYCETSGLEIDSASIETDYELIETCLNAIECLVKRCARDILDFIPQIMQLVLHLSTYDPNYSYVEEAQDDDDDWGSEDNSDYGNPADDSSWKIRRAALNVMDAVIKSRPEILSGYYTPIVECLVSRFKEREENVKLEVFKTFSTLIKSIVVGDIEGIQSEDLPVLLRTRSSADVFQDLLPMIVQDVSTEFSTKSLRIRQAVTSFLVDLSLSFPTVLSEHIGLLRAAILKNLEDSANSSIRIHTLTICKRIYRSHSQNNSHLCYELLPQIQAAVQDSYYKITTEGLKLITAIIKSLPHETRFILAVFPLVLEKLSLTDIDQEVKQATIYCIGGIISVANNNLSAKDVNRALELITDRLKNEVTRGSCLKALSRISQAAVLPQINSNLLKALCDELQNLLKKSLRALKLSTLETLLGVSRAYPISQASSESIVNELSGFISDSDLHLAQNALAVIEVLLSKKISLSQELTASLISNMNTLAVSPLLQGSALQNLCSAYQAVVVHLNYPSESLVTQLMAILNPQRKALEITAQCIASIMDSSSPDYLRSFINSCMEHIKGPENSNISILCIGEIGRTHDLSGIPKLTESLISLFSRKSEDVKICASVAFGKIAVGNLERFLPVIFSEFAVESNRYLLLNSIEEVISFKSERMAPYVGQILPVLFENAERPEENVRNIASECLGKLISVSPDSIISQILKSLHQSSILCKATLASSIKYAVPSKISQYSDYMEQVLPALIECFSIPDVGLKKACLIAINSIAHNAPNALKHNFSMVSNKVFEETILKQELIKKVDLGAFMHITDEGLPVRKAAYSVIETFIEQLPEKIDANRILEHVVMGLDDPSDEVQMLCHQLLTKLVHWGAGALSGSLNGIIVPIRKNVEKNQKIMNNKQEVERAMDLLRSALRCVEKIETQIETDSSIGFKEFLSYVASVPDLSNIMQSIKAQRESLFFI